MAVRIRSGRHSWHSRRAEKRLVGGWLGGMSLAGREAMRGPWRVLIVVWLAGCSQYPAHREAESSAPVGGGLDLSGAKRGRRERRRAASERRRCRVAGSRGRRVLASCGRGGVAAARSRRFADGCRRQRQHRATDAICGSSAVSESAFLVTAWRRRPARLAIATRDGRHASGWHGHHRERSRTALWRRRIPLLQSWVRTPHLPDGPLPTPPLLRRLP